MAPAPYHVRSGPVKPNRRERARGVLQVDPSPQLGSRPAQGENQLDLAQLLVQLPRDLDGIKPLVGQLIDAPIERIDVVRRCVVVVRTG